MEQRVSLTTLGVDDLERATAFYTALGWTVTDRNDEIVAFDLIGATVALYGRDDMARDMGLTVGDLRPGGTVLAHNVRTAQEVQPLLDAVAAAGGVVLKDAHTAPWGGTTGYFADTEGNRWEVACNPYAPLRSDGAFCWDGYDEHDQKRPKPEPA